MEGVRGALEVLDQWQRHAAGLPAEQREGEGQRVLDALADHAAQLFQSCAVDAVHSWGSEQGRARAQAALLKREAELVPMGGGFSSSEEEKRKLAAREKVLKFRSCWRDYAARLKVYANALRIDRLPASLRDAVGKKNLNLAALRAWPQALLMQVFNSLDEESAEPFDAPAPNAGLQQLFEKALRPETTSRITVQEFLGALFSETTAEFSERKAEEKRVAEEIEMEDELEAHPLAVRRPLDACDPSHTYASRLCWVPLSAPPPPPFFGTPAPPLDPLRALVFFPFCRGSHLSRGDALGSPYRSNSFRRRWRGLATRRGRRGRGTASPWTSSSPRGRRPSSRTS